MKILFLCVANSARSQLAEGLAKSIFSLQKDILIYSAGTEPGAVNPLAIEALREMGIDATEQTSKNVSGFMNLDIDVVITLCAEEKCPVFPVSVEKLHWPLHDPAGDPAGLESFRKLRDELRVRLQNFAIERNLV